MKYSHTKMGRAYQERIVTRFAWFPTIVDTLNNQTCKVWLGRYRNVEIYMHIYRCWERTAKKYDMTVPVETIELAGGY